MTEPRTKAALPWRVGAKLGRTLYWNDMLVGLVDTPEIAKGIVAVMNAEDGPREWGDKPLPEDEAIKAAHPGRTGQHETYAEAMRLVGARHSKRGLVELVNWLLSCTITHKMATPGISEADHECG